jgi:hypothetical protein
LETETIIDEPTADMLAQARIIAKGRRIRDVERLMAAHGGLASKWAQKSGPPFEDDGEICEFHWHEHPGIGRVELKKVKVEES